MNYTKKSFSVAMPASKEFADRWEQTFRRKEFVPENCDVPGCPNFAVFGPLGGFRCGKEGHAPGSPGYAPTPGVKGFEIPKEKIAETPLCWHLCRHDVLQNDCAECPACSCRNSSGKRRLRTTYPSGETREFGDCSPVGDLTVTDRRACVHCGKAIEVEGDEGHCLSCT